MACPGCEVVPEVSEAAGTLYLAPVLKHTRTMLERELAEDGWRVEEGAEHVLALPVEPQRLEPLLQDLGAHMSLAEQNGCPALFLESGRTFDVAQLVNTRPVRVLIARTENRWLSELIREEAVAVHFHPIVHAAQPQSIFAYECLLRGRGKDGELISPDRLFTASRSAELVFHLDRLARVAAIREASAFGLRTNIFINFNPTAIYDPAFCLRTTMHAIDESELENERFVFEVVESDAVDDPDNLQEILAAYRRKGFRVALDDLGSGYGSLNLLQRLQPDFVKLDRELVREVHLDAYKASITHGLLEMASRLGVATVAEGVEEYHEWQWLRDHNVDYVQGFYFAKPGSPPPESSVRG